MTVLITNAPAMPIAQAYAEELTADTLKILPNQEGK